MRLKDITIEITQRCPNYCIHCSSLSSLGAEKQLSLSDIQNIIDDAVELGAETISLSGGEPFMHPSLIDIVRHIHEKGVKCNIYTSGIIHNGNNFEALSEFLLTSIQSLVNKLIFNIEAADSQHYELIMGTNNGFELMQTSIMRALRYGFVIESHTVLMKSNINHLTEIMALGKSLGISKMSFLRLVMQGRALDNINMTYVISEEIEKAKEVIKQASLKYGNKIRFGIPLSDCSERLNCMAGTVKLDIRYDGNVYPCEAFKNDKPSLLSIFKPDNIKIRRLKDIYKNSPFLNDIRCHLECFQQINTCETCISQFYMNNSKSYTNE